MNKLKAIENVDSTMYRVFIKRYIDLLFSIIIITFMFPIMVIIACLIKVNIGSPIIFTQERPGFNEKVFRMYKFRTMKNLYDEKGNLMPDSVRLTKLGRFLRSTSLDELPELFNIVLGDMSFVGPRPLLTKYLPYYKDKERLRHSVKPGLTGLAQINGRNNLNWDDRLALDVKYVKNLSLINDLIIIARTFMKVILRDDIVVVDQSNLLDLDAERRLKNEVSKINS